MDEYEVSLNLSDGRVVVVTVQATSERDAIARARFDYGQQDASATFNYDVAPAVRRTGGTSATGGSGAGAGAGASGGGDSRYDYPYYNQTSPGTESRGAPPTSQNTPTLGSTDQYAGLNREQLLDIQGVEAGNEAAAIRQTFNDLNPGARDASSLSRGLINDFLAVLTNAFEGASASGRLPVNASIPDFVRGQTPRSARVTSAQNLLALLNGEGAVGETEFNPNEANDQLVTASGALGSQFRRGVQGRLGAFNQEVQSRSLDPNTTGRDAYTSAFDELFPNLRRTLERVAGSS